MYQRENNFRMKKNATEHVVVSSLQLDPKQDVLVWQLIVKINIGDIDETGNGE